MESESETCQLADLGIQTPVEKIVEWLEQPPTENAEEAIRVGERLQIVALVSYLARVGPPVSLDIDIISHNLQPHEIIRAWARGYRVVSAEPTQFRKRSLLREAVEKGMPMESIRDYDIPDDIAARARVVPPSVTRPSKDAEEVVADLYNLRGRRDFRNLRRLWVTGRGSKYPRQGPTEYLPPGLVYLRSGGCNLTNICLDRLSGLEEVDLIDEQHLTKFPPTLRKARLLCMRNIDDRSFEGCVALRDLRLYKCPRVTRCPASVEKLSAEDLPALTLDGCENLRDLRIKRCPLITRCPPSVTRLLSDSIADLSQNTNLKEFEIDGRGVVTRLPPLVEILHAAWSGIDDSMLAECSALKTLDVSGIANVRRCPVTVEKLIAGAQICGIDDSGLVGCERLRVLHVSDNPGVTRCPNGVEELDASGPNCGISLAPIP